MFVGFDQEDVEVTEQPVAAWLRFWLRAVLGESCHNDLTRLKLAEEAILGSQRRASAVAIEVTQRASAPLRHAFTLPIRYLAGQGLFDGERQVRRCLAPGTTFEIALTGPVELVTFLLDILCLASYLGGIGSRSRKGFGAFQITAHRADFPITAPPRVLTASDIATQIPKLVESVLDTAQAVLCDLRILTDAKKLTYVPFLECYPHPPERTAPITYASLAAMTLRWHALDASDWSVALEMLGEAYQAIRGQMPMEDFTRVIQPVLDGETDDLDPHFDIMGLPVHFKKQRTLTVQSRDREIGDRRASPLFFKVNKIDEDWFLSILLFNAVFLPDQAREVVKVHGNATAVTTADLTAMDYFWEGFPHENPDESTVVRYARSPL